MSFRRNATTLQLSAMAVFVTVTLKRVFLGKMVADFKLQYIWAGKLLKAPQ
ncbi:hypothetical protein PMI41_02130 [Phyllobacterium sp. YR531]|nr:hypothetical protein PMI41_02130 [Phyllobacterium sp. YR531]